MESWADHCSSDEEELKRVPSASAFATIPDEEPSDDEDDQSDVGLDTSNHDTQKTNFFNPPPAPKNIPTTPPFTAFMNNLVYDVSEEQLADEIEKLCVDKLNTNIKVTSVRFAKDRETNKRKGFGYVEVSTREELQSLLELNPIQMFGRKVRIDVAQNTRKGSHRNNNPIKSRSSNSLQQMNVPDGIDGSKFRGGAIRRSTSKGSSASLNKEEERPRLKLQPRSKPIKSDERSSSQSSIFGTGKKREEGSFRKDEKATSPKNGDKEKPKPARGSIRKGNKSKDKKEPPSNGTNGKKNKRSSKKTILVKEDGWTTSEATPDVKVDTPVVDDTVKPKPKPNVNEVKNKFAALGFDDDSSSE